MTLPLAVMSLSLAYLAVRTALFLAADYGAADKTVALFVLFAEAFILLHGLGYMRQIWRVGSLAGSLAREKPAAARPVGNPPVAVVVPSYHEPLDVLEATLSCLYTMTYPNKRIVLLDDTRYDLPDAAPGEMAAYRKSIDELCAEMGIHLFRRRWRGAKAGIINDFTAYLNGERRPEFALQSFGGMPLEQVRPEYMAVFDADHQPMPGFLEPLLAAMEADAGLAFVQTPQYYTNFGNNRIARASGLQQVVFFEFICQGKNTDKSMFCCGTNVLFRLAALRSVGGLSEDSVTEDFATSFLLHQGGWHSLYHDGVSAFGMGPEDLGGYFKQQFRWALGTTGLLPAILRRFFSAPRSFAPVRWLEYVLSSSYYLSGLTVMILMTCPILYIFFNVPSYFARPDIYALFFVPYFMMSMFAFYWTLGLRGYRTKNLIEGQLLLFLSFPVYIRASLMGLAGIRGRFHVTPKKGGHAVPWRALKTQLFFLFCNLAALAWGANRIYYERTPVWALAVNMGWCFYHFIVLCSMLYFNAEEKQ